MMASTRNRKSIGVAGGNPAGMTVMPGGLFTQEEVEAARQELVSRGIAVNTGTIPGALVRLFRRGDKILAGAWPMDEWRD